MGDVLSAVTVLVAIVIWIYAMRNYESKGKKIARMDADPTCTVKSDKWYRENIK